MLDNKGKLRIKKEQCETCIFRPGNPMHLQPRRVKQMVAQCLRGDSYVVCHDTLEFVSDEGEAVCRGFYDTYPGVGQLIRVAERLNSVEFV